jgi:DNA-binding transcriptional regulator YiaG
MITHHEFKAWRKAIKMTQAQLATYLGVSDGTVNGWENCRHVAPHHIRELVILYSDGKGAHKP